MEIKYTLICDGCGGAFPSDEAFPKLPLCQKCLIVFKIGKQEGIKEVAEYLITKKEYQRKWAGKFQILFGLAPDEFDTLREGKLPNSRNEE